MSLIGAVADTVTFIFLIVVISYYFLLFKRHEARDGPEKFSSITIIIPAHNEEKHIDEAIRAVLKADFNGAKQIIVVDDGSSDNTARIASRYRSVRVIHTPHRGKSAAINLALKSAKGELVAIVDADSVIEQGALEEAAKYLRPHDVAAVCVTVKVRNRGSFIGMWLHVEQLYNSLMRGLFAKANVNIVTPGPLSIYKKRCLNEIGGFETKGFSEDVDVAVRLLKHGYKIEYAPKSVSETYMPVTPRGFLKQRTRFARGWINIFKRHLRVNRTLIEIYTLPLSLFSYVQAVIMGVITLYIIGSGYWSYFASHGNYVNLAVAKYFIMWLSVFGLVNWGVGILNGSVPLTASAFIGLAAALLSYPLYVYAVIKYDRKFTLRNVFPIIFMFPYWLIIMVIYIINLPEMFRKKQENIWEKS